MKRYGLVLCLFLGACALDEIDEIGEVTQESGVTQCHPTTCNPGAMGNLFCQGVSGCGTGAVCLSQENREGSGTGRCFLQNTHEPIVPE